MVKIDKVTKMIEQPKVFLCHRNYKQQGNICVLHPIEDLKIYVAANAVDEITFTIHKYNNGVEFEYWDKIKSLNVVYVEDFGYFEVAVDTTESDDTRKVVTGASIEAELSQIYIDSLEINGEIDKDISINWTSDGSYIQTTIYNESDPEHSLLHRLLSNAAHWSFGEISESITEEGSDSSTSTVHRTFNFTNTNIYDALQEIAKELDVVFTFDTVNRKINMYDLNKIGKDTTIFVSTQNLATDFTCTTNKDSVKNCFKIVGGDEMINNAIRAVNPSGTDRIFHIPSEQMEGMSDKLKAKLQAYDALCERNSEEYTEACENLYNAIDKVYELETSMFPDRQPDAETTAEKEVAKLTASNLGNIPVENLTTLYETGAKKAVKTIAQLKVDYRYEVSIESSSYNSSSHTWTGKFKVENPSDGTVAISANDVTVTFIEDEQSSMQSKIDELLKDVDISDDTDINTFRGKLKDYSRDYLSDYEAIYKECTDILREKGYANKSDPNNHFYELYRSYWEKWDACVDELRTRKMEISKAEVEQHECKKKVEAFQHIMDFASNLGDCYKEFCLYRREDVYQNDNYISDGMNSSELLKNAKMLVEAATKELYKASILQTVYTANLNNLFTNPIYKQFYNNFELFNWIHADIDNKHVMLRLIGITYDFSAMEKIEVEFSEQVRNANGMTDIESILNQSKSMATSYSSTIKQAATGSSVGLEFSNMKKQGLNSSLMNIKSANEEVTIDSKGINCKSMDQNGDYDSHQLQITGKNIVLTDDDWETARMAIGDMVVEYDGDGDGVAEQHEIYGLIADYIQGDIVLSTDVRVLNKNSSIKMDDGGLLIINRETGTYVKIDVNSDNIFEIGSDEKNYTKKQILNTRVSDSQCNSLTISSDEKVNIEFNGSSMGIVNENSSLTINNLTMNTVYDLLFKNANKTKRIHARTKKHEYLPRSATFVLDKSVTSDYTFVNDGGVWTSNNQGVDGSTATATWTMDLEEDTEYTFQYRVSTKSGWNSFTIDLDGTTIVNNTGNYTDYKEYPLTLTAGTHTLVAKYRKGIGTNYYEDTVYLIFPYVGDTTTHKCKYCSLIDEHSFETVTKQPTCTEKGSIGQECSVCGFALTTAIDELGHDFDANGVCNRCGYEHVFSFTGQEFNAAVRKVFGYSSLYTTEFTKVTSIKFSDTCPTENFVTLEEYYGIKFLLYKDDNNEGTVLMYCNIPKVSLGGDMSYMFNYFDKLETIDLSRFDTSHVTNMSHMFNQCYELTSLDVSNFDTSNVADMSYMFCWTYNVPSFDLSGFDTSNVVNMSHMFYRCYYTASIDVSNFNTSKVTNMIEMFSDCYEITTLDLTSFDTSVADMSYIFRYCKKLTSITVTSGKWTTNTTYLPNGCSITYV